MPRLPFEVGQLAEYKSFQDGYRGAWFRCKIIDKKKGKKGEYTTKYVLKYFDYADEKLDCRQAYQVPPYCTGKRKEKSRELMLRPPYPPIYNEKQMPDVNVNSEVAVIVDNSWKVGDLVDWLYEGCYWSGKIIELLGDDMAKMELLPPPIGQGSEYVIKLKVVRPSLNWSLKFGWTLPTRDDDPGRSCARLVKPAVAGELQTVAESSAGMSLPSPASSHSVAVSDGVKSVEEKSDTQRESLSTTISKENTNVQGESISQEHGEKMDHPNADSGQTSAVVAEKDLNSSSPAKKHKTQEEVTLFSHHSDTLEAAVMDLEEALNKVKWLQKILKHEVLSDATPTPKWKFMEPGAAP